MVRKPLSVYTCVRTCECEYTCVHAMSPWPGWRGTCMLPEPPCSAGAVLNFFQSCVVFLAVRWLLDRIRLRSGNPAITLESTDFSPPVAATGGSGRWGGGCLQGWQLASLLCPSTAATFPSRALKPATLSSLSLDSSQHVSARCSYDSHFAGKKMKSP